MDLMNSMFRGLRKSNSGPNLSFSERLSRSRRSARAAPGAGTDKTRDGGGEFSGLPPPPRRLSHTAESPLPPRPPHTVTNGTGCGNGGRASCKNGAGNGQQQSQHGNSSNHMVRLVDNVIPENNVVVSAAAKSPTVGHRLVRSSTTDFNFGGKCSSGGVYSPPLRTANGCVRSHSGTSLAANGHHYPHQNGGLPRSQTCLNNGDCFDHRNEPLYISDIGATSSSSELDLGSGPGYHHGPQQQHQHQQQQGGQNGQHSHHHRLATASAPHVDHLNSCPSCGLGFDSGKRRPLLDSCGHERCYTCTFQSESCPLCPRKGMVGAPLPPAPRQDISASMRNIYARPSSRPQSPPVARVDPDCLYGSVSGLGSARTSLTPPTARRYNPSPAGYRRNWIQRHSRRPQTVNIDDNTMSGDETSSTTSSNRPPPPCRSTRHQPPQDLGPGSRAGSAQPSSLGQESGFQSTSSLLSLAPSLQTSPISTLSGSILDTNMTDGVSGPVPGPGSESGRESLASLTSAYNSQLHNQNLYNGGRRYSLSRLAGSRAGSEEPVDDPASGRCSRLSAGRRSARGFTSSGSNRDLATAGQTKVPFLQYRPVQWFLKPLFFEVPQRSPAPQFVGRQWLFREIFEMLTSDLPTNRGVIVSGNPGTGKTSIVLNLVEHSTFGRGDPTSYNDSVYGSRPYSTNGGSVLSLPQQQQSQVNSNGQQLTGSPAGQLAAQVVSYHFCQMENAPTCQVAEWVHSLAAQLSQAPQLRAYHQLLSTDHELRSRLSLTACMNDPSSALTTGVLEPLAALHKSGRLFSAAGMSSSNADVSSPQIVVVLIDGLCEAESHRPDYGHTLAGFVAQHLDRFPGWLKIVATVRSASKQIVRTFPFHNISLDNHDVDERLQKDLADYIAGRMARSQTIQTNVTPPSTNVATSSAAASGNGGGGGRVSVTLPVGSSLGLAGGKSSTLAAAGISGNNGKNGSAAAANPGTSNGGGLSSDAELTPQTRFQRHLIELARGSFLFARLVLDLLERGSISVKSATYGYKVLPQTLSEVFTLEFNLKFPTGASYRQVADILSVCLAAVQPLTLPQIYQAVTAMHLDAEAIFPNHLNGSLENNGDEEDSGTGVSLRPPVVQQPPPTWQEFLARFQLLAGFLVTRRDESVCFFHPLFREWLIRRGETDRTKFLCDPRVGHAALALAYARQGQLFQPDKVLELGHHVLKAHLYRNYNGPLASRDLQSTWLAMACDDVSSALSCDRNVFNPNLNVSRLLLLSGASPNQLTTYLQGAPLICVLAHRGYADMISLLLEFGADIDRTNGHGHTALSFAAMEGRLDTVRLLVENGASFTRLDKSEASPLVHAARNGHLSVVEYLVAADWETNVQQTVKSRPPSFGQLQSTSTGSGVIGLREAAQQACVAAARAGHLEVIEFMLDLAEVRVDAADTLLGETPLGAAAAAGHRDCCSVLIRRRGASLAATNLKESAAPLHLAAREGHWPVCELLLAEGGANINQQDALGRTPLILAAMEGHLGVVEHIMTSKESGNMGLAAQNHAMNKPGFSSADKTTLKDILEAKDKEGMTALIWSATKGRLEVVKYLITHGADVNGVDNKCRTPLDLAAVHGDPEVVQLLLERGAMMEHVDINGMRALDRAISCRNQQAVVCFLKKGAKLGPTTWAMAQGKPDILLALLNKLLEDGNTLYKRNKLNDAAMRYAYALKRLPDSGQLAAKHHKVFGQLRVHLLLNQSRCKRRLKEYADAIELASQAIEAFPHQFEAYHARAKARHSAGQLEAAYDDLTAAVRLAPANRELHQILINLKEEMVSVAKASSKPSSSIEANNNAGAVSSYVRANGDNAGAESVVFERRRPMGGPKNNEDAVGPICLTEADTRDSTSSSSGLGSEDSHKEDRDLAIIA